MEFIKQILTGDFQKVDALLDSFSTFFTQHPVIAFLVLFLLLFLETGMFFFAWLPGDSLLIFLGILFGQLLHGSVYLSICIGTLILSTISGYFLNYYLGKRFDAYLKPRINPKHFEKVQSFYNKYGNSTIAIARFIPIVRSLAPFVAGITRMNYRTFSIYSIVGAIFWVSSLLLLGYFLGNIPFFKEHRSIIILGVIGLSLIPILVGIIKNRRLKKEVA